MYKVMSFQNLNIMKDREMILKTIWGYRDKRRDF